ncbi:glutathione hydrolase 1 proenzyme-like [Ostrea edulis]|uniref:glutathione hydrolase 1 proenzyme-like n=1 Tax=Ostrea edulis TaxID=37623 RepID=UPI0024AF9D37|nr:glutathione hydrolase 1 proenzyme-like [Ostrea edulis]
MGSKDMSQSRLIIIATFLIIACIVALGLGLGFVLTKDKDSNPEPCGEVGTETDGPTTEIPTPAPTSGASPSIEGHYRYASIASDTGTCAQIGVDFMGRRQGSSVDAAIATILCQCVENSHSCGVGGGHFMTVYKRNENKAYTILAREMAPSAASEDMFVPENRSSTEGGLAIGVPGEIKGLYKAWLIGGKLPWKDLFQPTIKKLRDGWKVSQPLAYAISRQTNILMSMKNLRDALTNPLTGRPYKENEKIKMPKLADTFEKIADDPHTFYNGSLADDIVADIREAGGIITKEDLENYMAVEKDPLVVTLKDNSTIYTPPPPSSGAVYAMILNIADGYGFSPDSVSTTDKSIVTWHRIVEAMKFAYAKRSSLGDPDKESQSFKDTIESLVNNMTSSSYADYVRSQISDDATHDTMYYGPTFFDQSKTGTSHLAVLAPNGDAVSLTSTINLYFGSKVVGSRTGIFFNNEMDDFSTPNTTNSFGVPASAANFIKPGKRPLSSMCPSIVVDEDGHVKLVVGASGGTKITTSTALVSIETLWFNYGIKKAIDYKRLHHQLLPAHITVEEGFDPKVIQGLQQIGHNISMSASAGSVVQGILQLQEGNITANADYRKRGVPNGY